MEKNSPQHKHLMPSTVATDSITKFLAHTLDTTWAALVLLMLRDRKLSCNYLQALHVVKCGHNYTLTKTEKDGTEVLCLTREAKKDIYKRLWVCIANLKRHPIVGCVFSAMSRIPLKALNMLPLTELVLCGILPQFQQDPGKVTLVRWSSKLHEFCDSEDESLHKME